MEAAKHPKALHIVCLIQLFERCSFYGVAGVLVEYLNHVLKLTDTQTYELFGAFLTLALATSVISGWLADRYIGFRRPVFLGLLFIAIGTILLYQPNANTPLATLTWALSFIALGVGLFKPNISAIIGKLYPENDHRLLANAYTIFYIYINIGAFLGIIGCTFVAHSWGWHYAFIVVIMSAIAGLLTYILGIDAILKAVSHYQATRQVTTPTKFLVYGAMLPALIILYFLISRFQFIGIILVVITIGSTCYLVYKIATKERQYLNKMLLLLFLLTVYILFNALFMQINTSMNLFVSRNVDRNIFGFMLPPSSLIALNPLFVILLGPVVIKLWTYLKARHREPSMVNKFLIGMVSLCVAFAIIYLAAIIAEYTSTGGPLMWIVVSYFFITVSELLISPIGLAAVKTLAPPNLLGFLMGFWYLVGAFSNYISAYIAKFTNIPVNIALHHHHVTARLYAHDFLNLLIIIVVLTVINIAISPLVKRLMTNH